ncbi:pyrroline-5-carboxylate reductase [Ferrimonas sediminum]|uniref:Pyrroline-5-carboxylate reductase n=1 Tax=Ferrimonas sediminum TaxID=718193 RepID=A0A1G8Z8S9_9GAMM|nr:pyrroline-5-carboxylate reductase [Ferrimonas sediminum]SDK11482.1 pyrroline-5-carboxylate reductase [Ferrimonas sediminum]
MTSTIAFIGAGNMSRSIISGLVNGGYPADAIAASNPSRGKLDELQESFGIRTSTDNLQIAEADVLVLAVKPQILKSVCEQLKQLDLSQTLVLSIAAGVTCDRIAEYLQQPVRVVRAMPNTPSLLGLGMTGLFGAPGILKQDKALASTLMSAVGEIVWVEEESGIDQVIACAGSAPAYFFLMMEAMEQCAVDSLGVSPQQARKMIEQTAVGAAAMVKQNPQLSLAELRARVTSKGGTTAKAIEHFEHQGLRKTVDGAMKAAVSRAQEMAKLF